ncbi:ABC transporter ATP-binding protein [Phytoactinopolyspora halotolerans]|uniref:ABC transporter ATP-binding protein n=1 Tax=Phytoactinopolyspora halotolerans TaxID=1981512 RepID=A0A6L9SGL7_9ACTN|nr:ABC transporter ATP-binding protein [Phytoactinopolyspora halotolerans]NEE03250.1 ABC transporter ATP-binding protein [Phytoactinopolyspora halotolerans]
MDTVISVDHLRKTYADVVAVDDVSFNVHHGEIFGILGANGAGKTTTVEILQGLRAPTGGRLEVLGLDPHRETDRLRRRLGAQLQASALPDRLRVAEAVRLFGRLHTPRVDVGATLEAWGLDRLRDRPFGVLSGGERQRLFVALALLGDPDIVVLDELTTGLDPTARRATWDVVRQVRAGGTTVVLVTHFMDEAESLCDRVAVMDGGQIVACDTPRGLTARLGGPVTITFDVTGRLDRTTLLAVPGVDSVTIDAAQVTVAGQSVAAAGVAVALAEQGIRPDDYRTRYPTLEDVFLSLTGRPPSGRNRT